MEHVRLSDINTDEEKVRVLNGIIDNLNMVEGKLLTMISSKENSKRKDKK
ncbi:MAG: hypothetical protein ACYSUX_00395 [Planctomycetota bacterium]|jgi:hypothetical protein